MSSKPASISGTYVCSSEWGPQESLWSSLQLKNWGSFLPTRSSCHVLQSGKEGCKLKIEKQYPFIVPSNTYSTVLFHF